MPFAHVLVPAGALTVEKRQRIVALVTDAIIAAEDAPPAIKPYVTVLVSETSEGGWGIGGHGHTGPELRELVGGLAAGATARPR